MYVILYHFFINSRISTIAFLGHFTTQFPQDKQSASYITAQLSSICIASLGQLLWHRPQPDAAHITGISRRCSHITIGAAYQKRFSHIVHVDDLLRTGFFTQPTTHTVVTIDFCHALCIDAHGIFPTGFHTGATADASILTVVIVFSAVTCHISKLSNSFFHCHCTPFLYCWSAA